MTYRLNPPPVYDEYYAACADDDGDSPEPRRVDNDPIVRNLRGILNSVELSQDNYTKICDAIRALGGQP